MMQQYTNATGEVIRVGQKVKLTKAASRWWRCPEGREDNRTAEVWAISSNGAVHFNRDLRGCRHWNVDDVTAYVMLFTYWCSGFRNVNAESMKAAAKVFADRQARRFYGRKGRARTCVMAAHSSDKLAEFSAFIGYPTGRDEVAGKNFNFTVYRMQ